MKLNQPYYIDPRATTLSLNGDWQYTWTDEAMDFPQKLCFAQLGRVPSSVYWHLHESGILPHPYKGLNSRQYEWVDEKVWYYRRTFVAEKAFGAWKAALCFDGVAYYSRVWLNGTLLGDHEGMFGGPCVFVEKLLRYGEENELIVEVRACNFGRKKSYDYRNRRGENREIVPWNIARDNETSNGDMIVIGIWRDVRLTYLPQVHLSRPFLRTVSIVDGQARLRLEVEIIDEDYQELHAFYGMHDEEPDYNFAYNVGLLQRTLPAHAEIQMELRGKKDDREVHVWNFPVKLLDRAHSIRAEQYPESQFFEAEVILDNPRLWWPHDMGEPFLYDVSLTLTVDGERCDALAFSTGIRTVEAVRTAGDRSSLRWDPYQFVVNGRKIFLKGVNWMQQDVLYREDEEEYEWSLDLVRNAGIHLLRVWSGGGKPESDQFYASCDEKGILVWQDWFIANTTHTEAWPLSVLEDQLAYNVFRIRNHASLAVYCGGNEFNCYSIGNAASMSILTQTLETLDRERIFYRTTPVGGSTHIYRDMEPTWYRHQYRDLPFVAETGIHSFPSFKAMRVHLSGKECTQAVPEVSSEAFQKAFPELLNHFAEYVPSRVPRMLARASQIDDLRDIHLEALAEATQVASSEYYSVLIQALRENYPVTAGVMPWVFRRPWLTVGIQLVDGYGEPIAPYYAVKHAYAALESHIKLEHLTYAPGEMLRMPVAIQNEYGIALENYFVEVRVWDPQMRCVQQYRWRADEAESQCPEIQIPEPWKDGFFFIGVDLLKAGDLLSRQIYWPKCLSSLSDSEVLQRIRMQPQENLRLENGPWLKRQIACSNQTQLEITVCRVQQKGRRCEIEVAVRNVGTVPAFPVWVSVQDLGVRAMANDNLMWMEPGEERRLVLNASSAEESLASMAIQVQAWNADPAIAKLQLEK